MRRVDETFGRQRLFFRPLTIHSYERTAIAFVMVAEKMYWPDLNEVGWESSLTVQTTEVFYGYSRRPNASLHFACNSALPKLLADVHF